MNWQKNTGVMPCDGDQLVMVRLISGRIRCGDARDWGWGRTEFCEYVVTHYCLEPPPFDYVEPKVWTVEDDKSNEQLHIQKHGETVYSVEKTMQTCFAMQILLETLNAMEERNGTK